MRVAVHIGTLALDLHELPLVGAAPIVSTDLVSTDLPMAIWPMFTTRVTELNEATRISYLGTCQARWHLSRISVCGTDSRTECKSFARDLFMLGLELFAED